MKPLDTKRLLDRADERRAIGRSFDVHQQAASTNDLAHHAGESPSHAPAATSSSPSTRPPAEDSAAEHGPPRLEALCYSASFLNPQLSLRPPPFSPHGERSA